MRGGALVGRIRFLRKCIPKKHPDKLGTLLLVKVLTGPTLKKERLRHTHKISTHLYQQTYVLVLRGAIKQNMHPLVNLLHHSLELHSLVYMSKIGLNVVYEDKL